MNVIDTGTARTIEAFVCPFCKQRASIAEELGSGDVGVLHELPACETCVKLEPEDYLAACRKRRMN